MRNYEIKDGAGNTFRFSAPNKTKALEQAFKEMKHAPVSIKHKPRRKPGQNAAQVD